MFATLTLFAKIPLAFSSVTKFSTSAAGPEIVQLEAEFWHATSILGGSKVEISLPDIPYSEENKYNFNNLLPIYSASGLIK